MEIIESNRHNRYYVDENNGIILFLNPLLAEELEKFLSKEHSKNGYYRKKLKYLIKNKIINPIQTDSKVRYVPLTVEIVKDALINTKQLIFEVTDNCNLNCTYCGYGKLYDNYNPRLHINMDFKLFVSIYLYMKNLWSNVRSKGIEDMRISFYGGEPLLNFSFIEKAVYFINDNPISGKVFKYSMTTNGIYLNKYIDFLVAYKFDILVSIDGNKKNNSYRLFKDGRTSFNILFKNLSFLKTNYPNYFKEHIRFNSVLHDRNSVIETSQYIHKTFGIYPNINELNIHGVKEETKKQFLSMFHSGTKDYNKINNVKQLNKLILGYPIFIEYSKFINETNAEEFNKDFFHFIDSCLYDNYINKSKGCNFIPTGTCIPFSRRLFVSVTGKIYPCERIGNEIYYGEVDDDCVDIDFNNIVSVYNKLYNKYTEFCRRCSINMKCPKCIVSDIKGYETCKARYDNEYKKQLLRNMISFYEENADKYVESLNNINIS